MRGLERLGLPSPDSNRWTFLIRDYFQAQTEKLDDSLSLSLSDEEESTSTQQASCNSIMITQRQEDTGGSGSASDHDQLGLEGQEQELNSDDTTDKEN